MAELLPSELPLIIKKELIKAEDRINKTRTPNIDQDVVGGMPTDKPESTSIGETILDILCSQQFLKEWAKRLDDNKQNNLEFVGDKDGKVMREGAYGLGGMGVYITSPQTIFDFGAKSGFYREQNSDIYPLTANNNIIYHGYSTNRMSGIAMSPVSNRIWIFNSYTEGFDELYGTNNTYPDTNGFLKDRKSDLYALTNNKLTSDLNVDRTDYIASAKSAHDINKKAISAQNTANTAVTNAKTAQNRADSAYALAEKKRDQDDAVFNNNIHINTGGMTSRIYMKSEGYKYPDAVFYHNHNNGIFTFRWNESTDSEQSVYLRPPSSSTEDVAFISDTAALGKIEWTSWHTQESDGSNFGYGGSLSYALNTVPPNAIVCRAEYRPSGGDRQSRVAYRRIIRAGN